MVMIKGSKQRFVLMLLPAWNGFALGRPLGQVCGLMDRGLGWGPSCLGRCFISGFSPKRRGALLLLLFSAGPLLRVGHFGGSGWQMGSSATGINRLRPGQMGPFRLFKVCWVVFCPWLFKRLCSFDALCYGWVFGLLSACL